MHLYIYIYNWYTNTKYLLCTNKTQTHIKVNKQNIYVFVIKIYDHYCVSKSCRIKYDFELKKKNSYHFEILVST